MAYYIGTMPVGQELSHHGIRGMRWGQRRYQNRDGSLTAAGRVRYAVGTGRTNMKRGASNAYNRAVRSSKSFWGSKKKRQKVGKALKIAGTAAAVAGTAYLGAKYGKNIVKAGKRVARLAANNRAPAAYSKGRAAYGKFRSAVGAAGGKMRSAGGAVRSKANHLGYMAKSRAGTMKSRLTTPRLAANNRALAGNSKLRRAYGKAAGSVDAFGRKARSIGSTVKSKANHAVYVGKSRAGELKRRATTTRMQSTGLATNSKIRRAYGKAAGAVEGGVRKAGAAVKSGASTVRSKAGHAAYVGKTRTKAAATAVGGAAKRKAGDAANVVRNTAGKAKSKVRNVIDPNSQRNMRNRVQKKFAKLHKTRTFSKNGSLRNKVNRGLDAVEQRAKKVGGTVGETVRGAGYHARRAGAKAKNAARNVKYSAQNVGPGIKRAASGAGSKAKNAAKRAATNAGYSAKRQAAFIKKNPGAAAIYGLGRAGMGGLYYAHARGRGASKSQAAATGAARAIGGMKAGQAVGAGTRVYSGTKKAVKRYNSPRAKAYRARYRKQRAARKAASRK